MSRAFIVTHSISDAHRSDIFTVAACEAYTITGSGDGDITLWDNGEVNPKPLHLLRYKVGIHHLAVDGIGHTLAAVSFDGRLHLFDLKDLKPKQEFPDILKESTDSWAVALSSDGQFLAVTTVQGLVNLWDLTTGVKLHSLSTNRKGFGLSVALSSDASIVATGHDTGAIYMYSGKTGRLISSHTGQITAVRSLSFSPLGSFLAVAGDSEKVSLYSTKSGDHVTDLVGHEGWIFSVQFDETGENLFSVSYDGKSKIWSLEGRNCIATQNDSSQPLLCGQWFNKGWGSRIIGGVNRGVVTVGIDKTIRWYREAAGN
jgi:superkiller protein 8